MWFKKALAYLADRIFSAILLGIVLVLIIAEMVRRGII